MRPRPEGPTVNRAYLLAGRASRLPEKFLRAVQGVPILRRAARTLGTLGLDVAVVTVRPLGLEGIREVPDRLDPAPLGGLCLAARDTRDPCFLFGADMPFLRPSAIETMQARFRGRAVVPVSREGRWQVLHAIYPGGLALRAERHLLGDGAGLRAVLDELSREGAVDLLPPGTIDERSFVDIDTAEDLAKWDSVEPRGEDESVDRLSNSPK